MILVGEASLGEIPGLGYYELVPDFVSNLQSPPTVEKESWPSRVTKIIVDDAAAAVLEDSELQELV